MHSSSVESMIQLRIQKLFPLVLLVWLSLATRLSMKRWNHRSGEGRSEMSNRWLVRVRGDERTAKTVAELHGFRLIGRIEASKHTYEFGLREFEGRTRRSANVAEIDLERDPKVLVMWREAKLIREARQSQGPLYRQGWRLDGIAGQCGGASGAFMNVVSVWGENITGKGTVVTILDDGLEWNHPDIRPNYDNAASYDFNQEDDDPSPRYRPSNGHGTRCAGVVAAAALKNSTCGGWGIAFNARIGAVRMLDGIVTDGIESRALSYQRDHVDIYIVSWGPVDDGKTFDEPGHVTQLALKDGALKGRNGKGSIFVWAAGNGGHNGDSCGADGYINSIYTLAISAVDACGKAPPYTESCTSIQAVAFSSGVNGTRNITTTDLQTSCTSYHTGTSAAAPLAAGVIALAVEANSHLTWRDMQYITALTSKKTDPEHPSWHQNGAGHWISSQYGFGLLDAYSFITTARSWKTVPQQLNCRIMNRLGLSVDGRDFSKKSPLTVQINVNRCGREKTVKYLEHVIVVVSLSHPSRGDVKLTLISPNGTISKLLPYRKRDKSTVGLTLWQFMSVHHWGENPVGVWSFNINEKSGRCGRVPSQFSPHISPCHLDSLSLHLYGTAEQPYKRSSVFGHGHDSYEVSAKATLSPDTKSVSEGTSQRNEKLQMVSSQAATWINSMQSTVESSLQNMTPPSDDWTVSSKKKVPEAGATTNKKTKTSQRNLPRFAFADFSSFFGIDEKA